MLTNTKALHRGEVVGRWTLKRRLGSGGNGEVWLAEERSGAQAAIKFLTKPKQVAYARFRDEVKAMKLIEGVRGILPVLDEELPQAIEGARPWYAMPLAAPLVGTLAKSKAKERVVAIADAAETLAQLHSLGITHRDLKPQNLLWYEGRCHIGDFGLVDYPNKTELTQPKERLGAQWTMAPEVRRDGNSEGSPAADVYALGKTLWMILTNDLRGFDGQFNPSGNIDIKQYCEDLYITPLERVLSDCTAHEPESRPTMHQLADRIRAWILVSDKYREYNPLQWAEVQQKLFPHGTPQRATWLGLHNIVGVLNVLGGTPDLNHLFFPSGGGLDLESAVISEREPGCIELTTSGYINIIKPHRLMFEGFDDNPQWNYFRLETNTLDPSGVYSTDEMYEELTDLAGERYVNLSHWDEGEYEGEPLPEGSRRISRYFRGSFVIVQKTSTYNGISATYDGRHNQMDADTFRDYISRMIDYVRSRERTQAS